MEKENLITKWKDIKIGLEKSDQIPWNSSEFGGSKINDFGEKVQPKCRIFRTVVVDLREGTRALETTLESFDRKFVWKVDQKYPTNRWQMKEWKRDSIVPLGTTHLLLVYYKEIEGDSEVYLQFKELLNCIDAFTIILQFLPCEDILKFRTLCRDTFDGLFKKSILGQCVFKVKKLPITPNPFVVKADFSLLEGKVFGLTLKKRLITADDKYGLNQYLPQSHVGNRVVSFPLKGLFPNITDDKEIKVWIPCNMCEKCLTVSTEPAHYRWGIFTCGDENCGHSNDQKTLQMI